MERIWNIVDKSCFELLVLHRARWEYITLTVYNESELLTIKPNATAPPIRGPAPGISPRPSAIRFCEVPRLRSVTLWNIARPIDLFPWSQLTSLTLIHRPIVNTEILQLAVNLVHCHLILWSDDIPPSDVRLPSLESLVLARMWEPSPIDILRRFISKSGCRLQGLCITGQVRSEAVYRDAFSSSIPELSFDRAL
ncbi:hypothetical protein B0H14DRAFT_2746379, partial [Mycena olivaceomarginata]